MENIKGEYNSNIRSIKKSVRMTEKQYNLIQEKADAANTSFSNYLVQTALGAEITSSKKISELAKNMCQYYLLIEDVTELGMRKALREWGEQQCRCLK